MSAKIKFFVFFLFVFLPGHCLALLPSEVLVVANSFASDSVKLARYYMEKRGIPEENLLKIRIKDKEECSREGYIDLIAKPVQKAIAKNKKIQAIVTIYGVPLKVGAPALTLEERWDLKQLRGKSDKLKGALTDLEESDSTEKQELIKQLDSISQQMRPYNRSDYTATFDSKILLVLNDQYKLNFYLPNPYFVGYRDKSKMFRRDEVLMISRLDGPSIDLVKRMIDDSIATERKGLSGTAYFDAKKPPSNKKKLQGTTFYDQSLHLAAKKVKNRAGMSVVVDQKRTLCQPVEAPDAALYCGWYSYQNYIDAFDWVPGAVGYHIASVECHTLKPSGKKPWCRSMLEDGAAAVIGPVGEPYVEAFPVPEVFFSFLTDGYYNLVEAYFLSLPHLSWRMILVGDPLYRPFVRTVDGQSH